MTTNPSAEPATAAPTPAGATTAAPAPARPRLLPRSPLIVFVAAIVALVVVAVAAAGLAGGRTATYPEGSPEAALQAHLVAFQDGDYRAAYEQLSSNVQVAFTYPQYLEMASSMGMGMSEPPRVTIDRVLISGERATIDLGIEYPPSGGLFPSRYRQSLTVRLVREAGVWRINQKMFGASGMY